MGDPNCEPPSLPACMVVSHASVGARTHIAARIACLSISRVCSPFFVYFLNGESMEPGTPVCWGDKAPASTQLLLPCCC